jgi:hypothetical protein
MHHLSAERLAALVEDEPTALESLHLGSCEECARERAAHCSVVALARAEGLRPSSALTNWDSLSSRLRSEGMIHGEPLALESARTQRAQGSTRVRSLWEISALRAAAAVLLVAGGVIGGRATSGSPDAQLMNSAGGGSAFTPVADADPVFGSTAEAMATYLRAQRDLQLASTYLSAEAERAIARPVDAYQARLAALDELAATTRAALSDAPADPVINQFHLATLGAREATLRQMGATVPVGSQLIQY